MFYWVAIFYGVMSGMTFYIFNEAIDNTPFIENKWRTKCWWAIMWPQSLYKFGPRLERVKISRRKRITIISNY